VNPPSRPPESYYAGDLYGELTQLEEVTAKLSLATLFPGLLIAAIAALAAAFLSVTYGVPLILAGLLLGFALSFVAQDDRTHSGLDFASRAILRGGIILLGLQVTLMQIMDLGLAPFGALVLVMISALVGALVFARLAGQTTEAGILAGGATAICGTSAALALYGVIGNKRVSQTHFTITLVGITIASAIALTCYPLVAHWLSLSDAQAGFLTGAAIHDVAQAIGGGYAVSDEAGANATVIKLARVALLAPLVAIVAIVVKSRNNKADNQKQSLRIAVPGFIVLFLALLITNSFVPIPIEAREAGLLVSKSMLLLAVVATAMRSQLSFLLDAGWRTFMPVVGATVSSFLVALGMALAFG
jgi:uncharacterized integral membrane protein (TIGR00698 family)|tara:strand:+ start:2237 stop:3313 length:1077 start_codon:yes stop_codon:yes gene_type:complete